MKLKSIAVIAASILVLAGVANATGSSKPKVKTVACFGVQHGKAPSRYDLNLYGQFDRICIKGKPGKNGKNGKAGAKGAAGQNGLNGSAGAKGDTGAQGAQGEPGQNGAQGEPGPAGAQGPAGPAGPTGPQGEQGIQGETGATGPAGPQGEPGPPGSIDADGYYVCVSNGDNMKFGGWVDDPNTPDCHGEPGHDYIFVAYGVKPEGN